MGLLIRSHFLIKKKNYFLIKMGGQETVRCPLPITAPYRVVIWGGGGGDT